MNKTNLNIAQEKLYLWLSWFEKRSYNSIREKCDYLNIQYRLHIESYSVWKIFYPLVYSGVVDHVGNGYFALTEPLVVNFDTHYLYTNHEPNSKNYKICGPGMFICELESAEIHKSININVISILQKYPNIKSVINGYYESIVDIEDLDFHDKSNSQGVADIKRGVLKRYFSIPSEGYQRQIPNKSINPDGLNLAYYYERVINKQYNGFYNPRSHELRLKSFGLPIMIHRILMLDCLSRKEIPLYESDEYYYPGINKKIVHELNRILIKSIKIDE